MIRTVVIGTDDLLLENCTDKNGYAFDGRKGTYILARNTEGNFIWVRLTPGKTTKPVNRYTSLQGAIKAKIEEGYEVYSFEEAELK